MTLYEIIMIVLIIQEAAILLGTWGAVWVDNMK